MQHPFILLPFLYSFNFRDFCGSVGADVAPFLLLPTYPSLLCLPWPQNSGCKNAHPGFPREIKILLNPASSSSSGETKACKSILLATCLLFEQREKRKSREIFNTVPLLLYCFSKGEESSFLRKVTRRGVAFLKALLPGCKIFVWGMNDDECRCWHFRYCIHSVFQPEKVVVFSSFENLHVIPNILL